MDSIGEQENFGVGDVGRIGDDPFYRFPSKLREPWSSSDSQEFGRDLSHMDWDDDKPSGGGGASLSGIEIIWADQTTTFVKATDILAGYDPDVDLYWSLVLNVSSGVFDKVVTTFDATQDIFEDDGGTPPEQTKYRFRVITQGLDEDNNAVNAPISLYGQYREVTTCINGAPFQRLTKVT